MRRRISHWGPFVALLAANFTVSSQPHIPGGELVWDKFAHAAAYTVLSLFGLRAFHGGFVRPRAAPTLAAAAFMIVWCLSDEFHQSLVRGRDASFGDVAADLVGFGLAVLIARRAAPRVHGEPIRSAKGEAAVASTDAERTT